MRGTGVQNRGGEPESRTMKGFPPLKFWPSPLGALPPRLRVFGHLWYYPETSRSFQDHSRPFRDLPGWFWDVPEPFGTVSGCSGTIWIGSGLIRVTVNYPNDHESLSVRPAMIRKPFRLIQDLPTTIFTCFGTTWDISRVIRALP